METLTLVSSLFGAGAGAMVLVQLVKKLLGKIEGKYGTLITQAVLLAASFGVALLGVAFKLLPQDIVIAVAGVFGSAMAVYEVLWKGLCQQAIKGE